MTSTMSRRSRARSWTSSRTSTRSARSTSRGADSLSDELTRRDLIRVGGAGAAGLTLLGAAACDRDDQVADQASAAVRRAAPANAMNVVVVVMDSLRADHVYGHRARTPVWDKLTAEGLRFSRAYPEAMPTIPTRRSIMSGK